MEYVQRLLPTIPHTPTPTTQNYARYTQSQPTRGYTPVSQGPLFDDDPGIMSEVETASTGFRRGGKQRSSLPVVRTPSKTLERPLGMWGRAGTVDVCSRAFRC